MVALAEIQNLMEALNNDDEEPEIEKENKSELKEKMERFQTIVTKKTNMMNNLKEKMDETEKELTKFKHESSNQKKEIISLKCRVDAAEAGGSTCIDCKDRDESIAAIQLEEKKLQEENDQLKTEASIEKDIAEKLRTDISKLMKGIENMKKDYDNEVEKNVQKDDTIKHLKDQVDGELRVSMRKDTPRCIRCNRKFKSNQDLECHMQDNHSDKCTFCDLRLDNEDALSRHMDECVINGNILQECNKCHNKYTRWGMGRHMERCRGSQELGRPQEFRRPQELRRLQEQEVEVEEVSREVCRAWRRGNCTHGIRCRYSHVGQPGVRGQEAGGRAQEGVAGIQESGARNQEFRGQRHEKALCRNGPNCSHLARGSCKFLHRERNQSVIGNRDTFREQNRKQETRECWYQENCTRTPNCPFVHYREQFPPILRNKNLPVRRQ